MSVFSSGKCLRMGLLCVQLTLIDIVTLGPNPNIWSSRCLQGAELAAKTGRSGGSEESMGPSQFRWPWACWTASRSGSAKLRIGTVDIPTGIPSKSVIRWCPGMRNQCCCCCLKSSSAAFEAPALAL